jgi:hypothetical protein
VRLRFLSVRACAQVLKCAVARRPCSCGRKILPSLSTPSARRGCLAGKCVATASAAQTLAEAARTYPRPPRAGEAPHSARDLVSAPAVAGRCLRVRCGWQYRCSLLRHVVSGLLAAASALACYSGLISDTWPAPSCTFEDRGIVFFSGLWKVFEASFELQRDFWKWNNTSLFGVCGVGRERGRVCMRSVWCFCKQTNGATGASSRATTRLISGGVATAPKTLLFIPAACDVWRSGIAASSSSSLASSSPRWVF